MTVLGVSTSPRMTWLWAEDQAYADRLRAALDAAGVSWEAVRRPPLPGVVTDVAVGVEGLAAVAAAADAGFNFRWHDHQHPLNRHPDLYGFPIEHPPTGPSDRASQLAP